MMTGKFATLRTVASTCVRKVLNNQRYFSYSSIPFVANGKTYTPPDRPLAVICIDGCENEYLDIALANKRMPNLFNLLSAKTEKYAFRTLCKAALPSFTNVNNSCIISGLPPSETGIAGNFFINEKNEETMMNDNKYLRCENILEKASIVGQRKVAMITAKDKLRDLLGGKNIVQQNFGIGLSTEFITEAKKETHGISFSSIKKLMKDDQKFSSAFIGNKKKSESFSIYSSDASIFVLKLGVKLIENNLSDFVYLSLSDYIQHKHAPNDEKALQFYEEIDEQIGNLVSLDAVVGITADHGMNAKPNTIYLQTLLNEKFGNDDIRVICPITDPYVVHHGSLGSLVYIYLSSGENLNSVMNYVQSITGVSEVYSKEEAVHKLQLPFDRIGDIIVMSEKSYALGKNVEDHQIENVEKLRTHGGRFEQIVPFIISERLNDEYLKKITEIDLRNFDIFDFTCNGTQV